MNLTSLLVTFLTIVNVAYAGASTDLNAAQMSPTPAPTTPTNFPTAAPTGKTKLDSLPTPAPSDSSDVLSASQTAQEIVGAVGVAYSTTLEEVEVEESAGTSYAIPIAAAGCAAGVIAAVAAAIVIRKRMDAQSSTLDPNYSNAIHTPV